MCNSNHISKHLRSPSPGPACQLQPPGQPECHGGMAGWWLLLDLSLWLPWCQPGRRPVQRPAWSSAGRREAKEVPPRRGCFHSHHRRAGPVRALQPRKGAVYYLGRKPPPPPQNPCYMQVLWPHSSHHPLQKSPQQ